LSVAAKCFEAGDYPDKAFSLTPEEMRAAVANFRPVPLDSAHAPSVFDGKMGHLDQVTIEPDGITLTGVVRWAKWLDGVLADGERKVSASWDRATKQLTGLALVPVPRVTDAALMAAFAGSRHSASDAADIQNVHDIAVRQGADCHRSGDSPSSSRIGAGVGTGVGANMSTNPPSQPTLADRFKKWISGEGEVPAEFAASTSTPAADPEKDALKARLATLEAEAIRSKAAAFAAGEIGAHRALPAEHDAIVAAYVQAALDDATYGTATFAAGESRVARLTALFANRPAHTLTQDQFSAGQGQVLTNQSNTPRQGDEPMSAERKAALYAAMSLPVPSLNGK